jgi:hypothetical protein
LCLNTVLDACEAEPERVTGLLGNHEMSYLDPGMVCSGWKQRTASMVVHLLDRMRELLKSYVWVGDVLVSHAGVSKELLPGTGLEGVEEYLLAGEFNSIGRYRGGWANTGGLYWNDFNVEMEAVEGLTQVVGHTNTKRMDVDGVRVKYTADLTGATWCVDNLNRKKEAVLIEDGEVKPYMLGELNDNDGV